MSSKKVIIKEKNGIHFIANANTVNVTGYVQSINADNSTAEIDADKILDSVILQYKNTNGNWSNHLTYTSDIKTKRNTWLSNQIRPLCYALPHYTTPFPLFLWGYTEPNAFLPIGNVLQAGFQISASASPLETPLRPLKNLQNQRDILRKRDNELHQILRGSLCQKRIALQPLFQTPSFRAKSELFSDKNLSLKKSKKTTLL